MTRDKNMYFYDIESIKFMEKRKGLFAKVITGEKMQMAILKLDYGFTTNHSHPNEQMGYILAGEIELTIGDEIKKCGPGYVYCIPCNIQHTFKVLSIEGAECIEFFAPPKQENILSKK